MWGEQKDPALPSQRGGSSTAAAAARPIRSCRQHQRPLGALSHGFQGAPVQKVLPGAPHEQRTHSMAMATLLQKDDFDHIFTGQGAAANPARALCSGPRVQGKNTPRSLAPRALADVELQELLSKAGDGEQLDMFPGLQFHPPVPSEVQLRRGMNAKRHWGRVTATRGGASGGASSHLVTGCVPCCAAPLGARAGGPDGCDGPTFAHPPAAIVGRVELRRPATHGGAGLPGALAAGDAAERPEQRAAHGRPAAGARSQRAGHLGRQAADRPATAARVHAGSHVGKDQRCARRPPASRYERPGEQV